MLETLTLTNFSVGDTFKVYYGAEQPLEIILAKASPGRHKMPIAKREPFSLIFKGSKKSWLPQGSYRMEHGRLGTFEICIVPIMPLAGDQESYYYEAFFC